MGAGWQTNQKFAAGNMRMVCTAKGGDFSFVDCEDEEPWQLSEVDDAMDPYEVELMALMRDDFAESLCSVRCERGFVVRRTTFAADGTQKNSCRYMHSSSTGCWANIEIRAMHRHGTVVRWEQTGEGGRSNTGQKCGGGDGRWEQEGEGSVGNSGA